MVKIMNRKKIDCADLIMYRALMFSAVFVFVLVDGQSLGKCPKKETMKTFDPKEASKIQKLPIKKNPFENKIYRYLLIKR